MTAGPPGSGKSVDLAATGAADWFFFAPPGGLRVADSVLGVDLGDRLCHVEIIEDVIRYLPWVKAQGFKGVGVDDATELFKASHKRIRNHYALLRAAKDGEGYDPEGRLLPNHVLDNGRVYFVKGYDRDMWTRFDNLLADFIGAVRHLGLHAALTGRVQEPFVDRNSVRQRGGMDVAWKKLTPELIHACDLVQMAMPWPAPPWDKRVRCDENDPDYALKDRHNVLPHLNGPLNTAEVLRLFGHGIARPKNLAWMEPFVARGAEKLAGGVTEDAVLASGIAYLQAQAVPFRHAQWALRDAIHRGRLLLHRHHAWHTLTQSPQAAGFGA